MNFDEKYKDRTPEETVKIIQNFFAEKGFRIEVSQMETNIGTFSAISKLMRDGYEVTSSNGKGMTKLFSMASAMGELYERYCNSPHINSCVLFAKKAKSLNNGFNYYKDEKILSPNEVFEDPYFDSNLLTWCKDNPKKREQIVKKYCDNSIIGVEYKNILSGKTKWINDRLIMSMNGSNGSAAGNSYHEAFNEGYSEICERQTQKDFFIKKIDKYNIIPNDKIQNASLKRIINKIESTGKKVVIIDCYNISQMPVVNVLVIDPFIGRIIMNFGSFPVFEIALERCFTEMSQNVMFLEDSQDDNYQIPWRGFENSAKEAVIATFRSAASYRKINESILNKFVYVDEPDQHFLRADKQYSNEDIYEYWIDYIKERKIEVYVRENSLSSKLSAIRILEINNNSYFSSDDVIHDYKGVPDEKFNNVIKEIDSILDTIINEYNFLKFKNGVSNITSETSDMVRATLEMFYMNNNFLSPVESFSDVPTFLRQIKRISVNNECDLSSIPAFYKKSVIKYFLLHNYMATKRYTKEEVKNFFDFMNIDIADEDVQNWDNYSYILENAIYLPIWKYYHAKKYQDLVLAAITKIR